MTDSPSDSATMLIGADNMRRLKLANIMVVWEKDVKQNCVLTDCLKGKAHEWRLVTRRGWSGWAVNCSQCGARGTLLDLDNAVGCFYALRNERDEALQRIGELETQLNGMEHSRRTCETCGHPGTVSDCDGIWCGQGVVGRINKSAIVVCDEWEANDD